MQPLSYLLATAAALLTAPTALAQDFKLYGINYNIRAGPDAAPPATKCKSAAQIAHELEILKGVTDIVRLYSLVDCDQVTAAVPAIIAAGLKLELGLWVGPGNSVYADERDRFKQLIQNKTLINSDNVVTIHVGSEAIYRGDVDAATAIANLKEIKQIAADAGLDVPISIADIGDTYLGHPELFKEVDYVSANMFPFWEKIEADEAADQFYTRYEKVAEAAAVYNKTVVIGETGWASNGTHAGASEASPENAARFFSDFYKLSKEHDLQYYYFAAFDESWKLQYEKSDSTVEGYFGLFTSEGELKSEYAELTLDSLGDDGSEGSEGSEASRDGSEGSEGSDGSEGSESSDGSAGDETIATVGRVHGVKITIRHNAH